MKKIGEPIRNVLTAFVCAVALLAPAAVRAEVSIETSLSSTRVAVGEELVLDFIVTNAAGKISKPAFPPLDGFTSYSQGHSQEIAFVNGRSSSKSIFSYVLIPNSVGRKKIGPFEIEIGGKTFKVPAVDIDVVQASPYGGPSGAVANPAGPVSAPSARALPQSVGNRDIFVRAWLDRDEVYVNEPAMLTYTLYTRLSATYKGFEKEPVTTGFWVEDFPPEKTIRRTEQVFNGSRYVVADVRKMALFATQPGVYTLDTGSLVAVVEVQDEAAFNNFFSYNVFGRRSSMPRSFTTQLVQQTLPAEKATLTVKALPETGRPSNFEGAVGDYRIESSVDKSEVEAGTPITYRVRLKGRGNLNTAPMPSLPKMDGFRIYDSSTSSQITKDRLVVEGEKVTDTVIVPRKAGTYTIPVLEFAYFDPAAGAYRKVRTSEHTLTVKPGTEEPLADEAAAGPDTGSEPVDKTEVAVGRKDIRYIKPDGALDPWTRLSWVTPRAYAVINGLLALLTALAWILLGMAERPGGAVDLRGMHRAARRRLQGASAKMKAGREEEFYAEISKSLSAYFGGRLGIPAQSVTFEKIRERFGSHLQSEQIEQAEALLREIDLGRFGRAQHGTEEMRKVYAQAMKTMSAFDKVRIK